MIKLMVYQWIDAPPHYKEFRIVETRMTIDGPRSRLTDKLFKTCDEARKFVEEHNDHHE